MGIETLFVVVAGLFVGMFVGTVLLSFFDDEIFNFIDSLVYRVRRFFGLEA